MENYRGTEAVISTGNLLRNLATLRALFPNEKFICPMVKANAYGHGDYAIARALEGAGIQTMGVGLVEEGIALREKNIKAQLLVFGVFDGKAIDAIRKYQLTPVVSTWDEFDLLQTRVPGISIHLKFDTGMHRLGFSPDEAQQVRARAENAFKIEGVLTHLHTAEDLLDAQSSAKIQLQKFEGIENVFRHLGPQFHALNSAGAMNVAIANKKGIVLSQSAHGIRPGTLLYGYSPVDLSPLDLELKPVMSFRSKVIRYHQLNVGDTVSYGATWRAKRASIIGVVPVGYADGYRRGLSNKGKVLFLDQEVPVVGNVCMDYVMIDLTEAVAGKNLEALPTEVTLFGESSSGKVLSAADLASYSGTITWDILTSISERVPRRVIA